MKKQTYEPTGLRARGVTLSYGDKAVLADVWAEFPAGSRTVVMGPSGCGKTTLLRVLSGLEVPTAGEAERTAGPVSWVFQENRLAEDFSAVANLRMIGGVTREQALALLGELGLGRKDSLRPVRLLSGGMKRRVAIGRALLSPGGVLFLDEPFTGLDAESRDRAAEVILAHLGGRTVLAVSHEEEDAARLGAQVLRWDGEQFHKR